MSPCMLLLPFQDVLITLPQNINYHRTFKVNINTVGIRIPDIQIAEPFKWLINPIQGSECPLFEWLYTIQMPFEY